MRLSSAHRCRKSTHAIHPIVRVLTTIPPVDGHNLSVRSLEDSPIRSRTSHGRPQHNARRLPELKLLSLDYPNCQLDRRCNSQIFHLRLPTCPQLLESVLGVCMGEYHYGIHFQPTHSDNECVLLHAI